MDYSRYFKEGVKYNVIGSDEDSAIDIISSFIAWGVRENKKCFYYVDRDFYEELEFFIQREGLNLIELIGSGKLIIGSSKSFYIEKKAPLRYANLLSLINNAVDEGYNGIAIAADRDCFFESGFTKEILYEYEKSIVKLFSEYPISALSYYNIDKFGVDALFALNHVNPNFIYKLGSEMFVHNYNFVDENSKENLEMVYNFLKTREKIKKQNKLYQFMSKLSEELSYKRDENDIIETSLSSICKSNYASFGGAVIERNGELDFEDIIYSGVSEEVIKILIKNLVSRQIKLSDIFLKVSCKIIHIEDLKDEEEKIFKIYDIYSSIIIPIRCGNQIFGYIYLLSQNKYISFDDNSGFLCKVCENIAKMIIEYRKHRKTQEELIQARKMKALGELTGGIAHEFNNILTPVLGYTQVLKSKIKDPEVLKYINMIENSALDGAKIVKRIQDFSRPGHKKREPLNIDNEIRQCVDIIAPGWTFESSVKNRHIDIKLDLKSDAMVEGIGTEIREIFINLMTNAADAMPSGGSINISSQNDNGEVIIKVRDTGAGMTRSVLENIFDPFFTTKKEKGNGLGLPIVYNIIKEMKGSIYAESKLGVGTEFTIRLPINHEIKGANKVENSSTNVIAKRVLIIDDQAAVSETVCEMLKSIGHHAEFALDENTALNKFKSNNFDCVLCDLSLGKVSGIKLSKEFKNMDSSIRFVLMTGWLGKLKAKELEYVDYILQKPFSINDVNRAVCEEIKEKIKEET